MLVFRRPSRTSRPFGYRVKKIDPLIFIIIADYSVTPRIVAVTYHLVN